MEVINEVFIDSLSHLILPQGHNKGVSSTHYGCRVSYLTSELQFFSL